MARPVDLSIFLNAVKQTPALASIAESQQQQIPVAPRAAGNAVQMVLHRVLAFPDGIDLGLLYKETALDFNVFADAVERLKKLEGVRVVKGPAGEIAFPGPNSREVESLIS